MVPFVEPLDDDVEMPTETLPARERVEWLDVARGILIILVIFGHLIEENLSGSPGLRATYLFIYAFHIPAFIFASGYVSDSEFSRKSALKTLASLIQPLIVCQILYWIIEVNFLGGWSNWQQVFLVPYWLLWYLFSLAVWRLMLVFFSRCPQAILVSVLVALVAGLIEDWGYLLSISRTLVFFPFFLAGHLAGKNNNIPLPIAMRHFPIAIGVFIAAGFAAYTLANNQFDARLLYHSMSYGRLELDWDTGIALRMASLAIAAILTCSFFAVIPKKSTFLAQAGRHSLFAYLSHGIIIKLAIAIGLFEQLQKHSSVEMIFLGSVLAALAFAVGSTKPVLLALQKAIYLPITFLMR